MARTLNIAVDLDSTVVDMLSRWLEAYNLEYRHGAAVEDLLDWDVHQFVRIGKEIYKYLNVPRFYLDLEPLPGACEALQYLHQQGHEIHIVSAPSQLEQTAADKLTWCSRYLSFLDQRQVTLTHEKHLFLADVLIDDSPRNIREHAQTQPRSARMSIAWPYNLSVKDLLVIRAESYKNTKAAWDEMVAAIEKMSRD